MIARVWRGVAQGRQQAEAYLRHFDTNVRPELQRIAGYREARVLRRERELLVITYWESMQAIRKFAGADPERAVVEPEARAVLAEFDDFVRHYEVER